jgi:predicted esterase
LVGGFGQGGALAIHAAMPYTRFRLAGVVSFAGYVSSPSEWPARISAEQRNTPVLAYHGRSDRAITLRLAKQRYRSCLTAHGVKLQLREMFDLGHYVQPQQLVEISSWWDAQERAAAR